MNTVYVIFAMQIIVVELNIYYCRYLIEVSTEICLSFFHSVFNPPVYCKNAGSKLVPVGHGYLSSHVTDDTGCGSIGHPWLIEISKGQQITFSLLDFSGGDGHLQNTEGISCTVYAYISEPTLAKNSSICGGLSRERELYTSTSSRVQVQVSSLEARGSGAHFLLKYEGKDKYKTRVQFVHS